MKKRTLFYKTLFALIILNFISFKVSALSGTHSFAVSTFDTTRSTVSFSYHHGFMLEGGSVNFAGYNANFTSTTGKLSSQFGLNYVGINPPEYNKYLNGVSGSAVAVYGIPIGNRYANGMPKASFSIFMGSVPTALFSNEFNYVTIPINIGLGIEVNPVKFLSITGWFEIAPSFNIDTVIKYDNMQKYLEGLSEDDLNIVYGPDGMVETVTVNDYVIDNMVSNTLELEYSFSFRMRGGLQFVLNLGDKIDLQLDAAIVQAGSNFDSKSTIFTGAALVFAWDDAPIGILPKEERFKNISCGDIVERATHCPSFKTVSKDTANNQNQCKVPEQPAAAKQQNTAPVEPEQHKSKATRPLSPEPVGSTAKKEPAKPLSPPSPEPQPKPQPQKIDKKPETVNSLPPLNAPLPSLNQPLQK
ncbi:MAG: hypothetical protein JXR91_00590 [Deltaproteobacteria bacterium]|nr:hypothetical protein [Deltaproteobacteria bacterium]